MLGFLKSSKLEPAALAGSVISIRGNLTAFHGEPVNQWISLADHTGQKYVFELEQSQPNLIRLEVKPIK